MSGILFHSTDNISQNGSILFVSLMAVIEVCDICDKKVDMSDGITIKCSDNKGFSFICGDAVRHERNYDVMETLNSVMRKYSDRIVV